MYKHRIMEGPDGANAGVIELFGTLDSETAREFKDAVKTCLKSNARDLAKTKTDPAKVPI